MNSPVMTPIIDIVIPILRPEKMCGAANGSLTWLKICQRDAVSERHSRTASCLVFSSLGSRASWGMGRRRKQY